MEILITKNEELELAISKEEEASAKSTLLQISVTSFNSLLPF